MFHASLTNAGCSVSSMPMTCRSTSVNSVNYNHRWHAKLFAMQRTHWCYQELTIVTRCLPTLLALQQSDSSHWSIWLLVLCSATPDSITTDFTRDYQHWLPVRKEVDFKICSMVYKAQHGLSPIYITEMMKPTSMIPRRQDLRSASHSERIIPRHRTKFAERAFMSLAQCPGIGFHRQSVKRYCRGPNGLE